MPLILAIESSSHVGAIALVRVDASMQTSDTDWSEVVHHEIKLSGWILPAVQRVLARANASGDDVDAVAFGGGPGSFSGVRTACATAQALAYAWEKPLIRVDSLEALAEASQLPHVTIAVDARMQEIYVATFMRNERNDAETLTRVTETVVCSPTRVGLVVESVALGSGAHLLTQASERASDTRTEWAESQWAHGVARVAARQLALGQVTPATLAEPLYVRNNVAQTEAERAAALAR